MKNPVQEQQKSLGKCLVAQVKEKGMNVCQECDEYQATDTFIMVWFVPFFFFPT